MGVATGVRRSDRELLTTPVTVEVQWMVAVDVPLEVLGLRAWAVGFSVGRVSSTISPVECERTSMRNMPWNGNSVTSSSHSQRMPAIVVLPLRLPLDGIDLSM